MKRMELKITLTFVIMLIVGIIINGIYNVITTNSNFFTCEVVAGGFLMALVYLGYIWISTRRHQLLIILGLVSFAIMITLISISSVGVAGTFSAWNWYWTIWCIYCSISCVIAKYHGKKLLQEDKHFANGEENDGSDVKIIRK